MGETNTIEKFSSEELSALRSGLVRVDVDYFQATHLLAEFLEARGYGVDARLVPEVLLRLESQSASPDDIQEQLERVALVM